MKHEFTLEMTIGGAFAAEVTCRAEINTEGHRWAIDDVDFWGCREGRSDWVTLDRQNALAIEIERQAKEYLAAPATRLQIDALVGHHFLEAGVIPVPEYEHLTKHDYGLRT